MFEVVQRYTGVDIIVIDLILSVWLESMGLIIISSGLELLWAGFSCVGVNSLFSSHIHEILELVLDRLDSIKNYEVVVKFLSNKLSKQGFQTSFAYSFQTKHKKTSVFFFLYFVWKLYTKLVWKPCLDSLFGRNFTTTL